jgi:tRNA-uridine 2-sulfurtransferase
LFIPLIDIHWIREDLTMKCDEYRSYLVRVRYRQPLQKAGLYMKNVGLFILFEEKQRGITPGQFAVWYDDEELIGSGVID